jgi:hypothetical protein
MALTSHPYLHTELDSMVARQYTSAMSQSLEDELQQLREENARLASAKPKLPGYIRVNFRTPAGTVRFYGADGTKYESPCDEESDSIRFMVDKLYQRTVRVER